MRFYTSNTFSRVPIPTKAGVYECTISLDSLFLAAGQYGVDLLTTHTNVSPDHEVDNAIRFFVETCNPRGIAYNFTQDLGNGTLALSLSAPLHFTPLPPAAVARAQAQSTGQAG